MKDFKLVLTVAALMLGCFCVRAQEHRFNPVDIRLEIKKLDPAKGYQNETVSFSGEYDVTAPSIAPMIRISGARNKYNVLDAWYTDQLEFDPETSGLTLCTRRISSFRKIRELVLTETYVYTDGVCTDFTAMLCDADGNEVPIGEASGVFECYDGSDADAILEKSREYPFTYRSAVCLGLGFNPSRMECAIGDGSLTTVMGIRRKFNRLQDYGFDVFSSRYSSVITLNMSCNVTGATGRQTVNIQLYGSDCKECPTLARIATTNQNPDSWRVFRQYYFCDGKPSLFMDERLRSINDEWYTVRTTGYLQDDALISYSVTLQDNNDKAVPREDNPSFYRAFEATDQKRENGSKALAESAMVSDLYKHLMSIDF